MQYVSYAMDILLPEILIRVIMDTFEVSRSEVWLPYTCNYYVATCNSLGKNYYVH